MRYTGEWGTDTVSTQPSASLTGKLAGKARLTPATESTSFSYSSRSDTSMKHLSRMPAGMKYSARRCVSAKFTVPSTR